MKEITLEERRKIQIDMMKEFDAFCRKNNLRYSLAYGTLLGAIRHKGFIPWDDDMDIMMPLNDMYRMRSILKSDRLEYCDVDTCKYYDYAFARLTYKQTFCKQGLIVKGNGVPIDLYPIYSVPDSEIERNEYFRRVNEILKIRKLLIKWKRNIIKIFPIKTIPLHTYYVRKYRDFCEQYRYGTNTFACSGMASHKENILTKDVFENTIDVDFEGERFMAIAEYDYFLKNRYGDYMQLPPEEDRRPYHGGNYYWKD